MAATMRASGRSMPASARAASAASVMRSGRLSSRFPKRVIPAPAIQTSFTLPFQTGRVRVSTCLRERFGLGRVRSTWCRRARRDADLELPHQSQEIRPLETQGLRRARPVAAGLGQARLDEPAFELGHGTVEAHDRPRRGRHEGRHRSGGLGEAGPGQRALLSGERAHGQPRDAKGMPGRDRTRIQGDALSRRRTLHEGLGNPRRGMHPRLGNAINRTTLKTRRTGTRIGFPSRRPGAYRRLLRPWWPA